MDQARLAQAADAFVLMESLYSYAGGDIQTLIPERQRSLTRILSTFYSPSLFCVVELKHCLVYITGTVIICAVAGLPATEYRYCWLSTQMLPVATPRLRPVRDGVTNYIVPVTERFP